MIIEPKFCSCIWVRNIQLQIINYDWVNQLCLHNYLLMVNYLRWAWIQLWMVKDNKSAVWMPVKVFPAIKVGHEENLPSCLPLYELQETTIAELFWFLWEEVSEPKSDPRVWRKMGSTKVKHELLESPETALSVKFLSIFLNSFNEFQSIILILWPKVPTCTELGIWWSHRDIL